MSKENFKYCMKNKCNGCKNYNRCFEYKPRKKGKKNVSKGNKQI